MSLSSSPKLVKGGLVMLDPSGARVLRTIALQYNPDTLSRSYQVQGVGGDGAAERAQPFRLKGPAVETIKLEAEIDATDPLGAPDQNPDAVRHGIAPQLAALEALVNPGSDALQQTNALAASGTLEIVPPDAPLLVFVFGRHRVQPVRVTELSITEEAFDPALNPIRAKVTLGLRVLSVNDVPFDSTAGALFRAHQQRKEALAQRVGGASLDTLGIGGLL